MLPFFLGTALVARPKPLAWSRAGAGWAAPSALGIFSVQPIAQAPSNLWIAALNGAPFPIIAPDANDARNLATLAQVAHGDSPTALTWTTREDGWDAHGFDANGQKITWQARPSQGTAGWYLLRGVERGGAPEYGPPFIALADSDQAQGACAQYAAYVWLALGEILGQVDGKSQTLP